MTVFILNRHDNRVHIGYKYGYDVVAIMEKERYTFRLSPETIQQLDELVEKGIIQNRTDGVIKSIEMLYDSSKYDTNTGKITDLISWATESPQIASEWHLFPIGVMFPIFKKNGNRVIMTKMGPDHVELVRDVNGNRLVIFARKDEKSLGISSGRDYTFLSCSGDMTVEEREEAIRNLNDELKRKEHDKTK